jgi:rhamnulokinase
MKPVHCAAVDLGATSGRVVVGTWNGRSLRLSEVHRFPNQFRSMGGHDYWSLPDIWSETRTGLAKARDAFPGLASVGVDGWAVDHVLLGADGRQVHPVHAYRDPRTARASARLSRSDLSSIYSLTGIPNYAYNTSLQLEETLAACPGIERVAHRCLFIPDYFNYLLSGRMENELSIASHSQLLDARGCRWSPGALRRFGVPSRWFQGPSVSPRRLGAVQASLPELKGVLSILVPGHDTACAFAAMPAAPCGSDLFLSSGTWSLLGFESGKPFLGSDALRAGVSNERMGDGTYRPLKSCLGLWLIERVLTGFDVRPAGPRDWKALIDSAEKSPVPSGHLGLDDQSLFNPASMKDAIDSQLRRRGVPLPRGLAAYVSLICRSIARGHASAAADLARLAGRPFGRIIMVGGGSQNRLLCQATADAAGLPVSSYSLEGAAVGNLASQLIALGEVGELAQFRMILSRNLRGRTFNPA